jgi:hypothetical protein
VYDNAWVYGDAQVYGNAWVYGDAWVYGNAQVSGNARVYGDARVQKHSDYLTITTIGSENGTFTAYRTEQGAQCNRGCFHGTLDEFSDAVEKAHGTNDYAAQYRAVVTLVRLRFGLAVGAVDKVET